jgi:hypothetical protein
MMMGKSDVQWIVDTVYPKQCGSNPVVDEWLEVSDLEFAYGLRPNTLLYFPRTGDQRIVRQVDNEMVRCDRQVRKHIHHVTMRRVHTHDQSCYTPRYDDRGEYMGHDLVCQLDEYEPLAVPFYNVNFMQRNEPVVNLGVAFSE